MKPFEEMKMRKDISILAKKYKIPLARIADEFGVPLNTLRDFVAGRGLSNKNYARVSGHFNNFLDKAIESINYAGFDNDMKKEVYMSRLKDQIIHFHSDCEVAIEGAECMNDFKAKLIKIDKRYDTSFWLDDADEFWNEYHGKYQNGV